MFRIVFAFNVPSVIFAVGFSALFIQDTSSCPNASQVSIANHTSRCVVQLSIVQQFPLNYPYYIILPVSRPLARIWKSRNCACNRNIYSVFCYSSTRVSRSLNCYRLFRVWHVFAVVWFCFWTRTYLWLVRSPTPVITNDNRSCLLAITIKIVKKIAINPVITEPRQGLFERIICGPRGT